MKTYPKVLILLTLVVLTSLSMVINSNYSSYQIKNSRNLENKEEIYLKKADFWTFAPFTIDESGNGNYTWLQAEGQSWCTGSGIQGDPYIIENVTIDGGNSSNCIWILNSNSYFIIRNCTFYNSGIENASAGIMLSDTINGQLINNTCSNNNGWGISLYNSNHTIITNNTVNNNKHGEGISLLYNCHNNNISENIVNNNTKGSGIRLDFRSNNNNIFNNTGNNNDIGISLLQSNYNNILNNTVNNNIREGIHLVNESNYNIISENTITNNSGTGIILNDKCINNNITENIVNNNSFGIFLMEGCNNNNILENNISYSDNVGIFLMERCNYNNISGNTLFGNKMVDIYECNCEGNVYSNNGNCTILINDKCYDEDEDPEEDETNIFILGYDILFLIVCIFIGTAILIKKRFKHLN